MKTPLHQIAAVLAVHSEKSGSRRFAESIAAYLLETGRTGELESLSRDMVSYRAAHGIVEVMAVSAHELEKSALIDIRAQIKQLYPDVKEIIINERHDASVVGGVRLEFPEAQLDLSIRNQLNRFKALTTYGKDL